MAKLLKLRRGTTTQHGSFTGAEGEVTIDTDKDTAVVHDGSTAGGTPLAREDMSNVSSASIAGRLSNDSIAPSKIGAGTLPSDVTVASANIVDGSITSSDIADGTIVNADINASAGIANSKLADSGVTAGQYGSSSAIPIVTVNAKGVVTAASTTAVDSTKIQSGTTEVGTNNSFVSIKITGTEKVAVESGATTFSNNIAFSGTRTVDGRNIATDGSKLDGIESGATADQTAAEIRTLVESATDSNVFTDADHTKLNGIETGATADQTAAEIRTLVESASDSNVFTDADHSKLNGIESGATADQTASEIVSLVNGQTITPAHIHVGTGRIGNDSNDYIAFANNSHMDVVVNGSTEFRFEADGDFHADGDITAFSTTVASDSRLKSDIHTINNALGIVGKLRGVSYKWLRDGRSDIGVIAQEVEEVIPEIVKTKTTLGLDGQEEMKTVDYGKIVGVLINAINELKEEVEELKNAKITG